jgi:N-acetylglucosaminyldiphosphoundecaprenol N-acetyl-beta-D-mannosaminyltransferase
VIGAGWPIRPDGRATTPERDEELVERIRASGAAIVLVGLGAPKQERWITRHADDLVDVRIAMGIGGAFEMWGGTLRRAPRFLRRLGLEWAWRLVLEPRRLPRVARAAFVFPYRALTDRAG